VTAKIHPQPDSATMQLRFAGVYSVLRDAIATHAFPGCAFGLVVDDQILLLDSLGHFTYDADSPAVQPNTLFDIASLTKVVATTSVAMLLYQCAILDLETPVGDVLPGFVIGRDPAQRGRYVTLRHLLAHSSGLPCYYPFFHIADSPQSLMRHCLELPLHAEPGTHAEYSDPGFILFGKALETIASQDLATFAHHQVFIPLEMDFTGFCPPQRVHHQIPPTERDELFRQRTIQGEVQDEHAYILRGVAGHAGLFSNVSDLLRFSTSILGSDPSQRQLFHRETVETFARRQPPSGSTRALGWDTPSEESSAGKYFSPQSIGHLGYSGCSLWIDPEARLAAVLLTNRTWPHRESQLIRTVRPAFHDALRKSL